MTVFNIPYEIYEHICSSYGNHRPAARPQTRTIKTSAKTDIDTLSLGLVISREISTTSWRVTWCVKCVCGY